MKRIAPLALGAVLAAAGCTNAVDDIVDNRDLGTDLSASGPLDMTYVDFGPCGNPAKSGNEPGGTCTRSVTGTLVDENGKGIGNSALITVCANVCYNGKTGSTADDGTFSVPIQHDIVTDNYALEVHGRPDHACYYLHLPPGMNGQINYAKPVVDPTMPPAVSSIALDKSAQTLTSGDVTLTIPAGTDVTIDPEDALPMANGSQFRALTIKDPLTYQFVDAANPPLALYAFEPFEVMFSQKVQFSFVNNTGLAANAKVDVRAMRSLLVDAPPAGALFSVAKATVSSDGKTIVMNPGEGVTWLTWFALFPG